MPYISKTRAREYGYPNPNLQTIQIPDKYSLTDAQIWLEGHGFLFKNWRKTKNFYRFMQNDVIKGAEYYSDKLPNGIVFTYQKY